MDNATISMLRNAGWSDARNDLDDGTWWYPPTCDGEPTDDAIALAAKLRMRRYTTDEGEAVYQ